MTVHDYEDEECPKCSEVAAWTSEPPTRPGFYFFRPEPDYSPWAGNRVARVLRDNEGRLYVFGAHITSMYVEDTSRIWWPIPIPEPPSQITPPISDKGDPAQ